MIKILDEILTFHWILRVTRSEPEWLTSHSIVRHTTNLNLFWCNIQSIRLILAYKYEMHVTMVRVTRFLSDNTGCDFQYYISWAPTWQVWGSGKQEMEIEPNAGGNDRFHLWYQTVKWWLLFETLIKFQVIGL